VRLLFSAGSQFHLGLLLLPGCIFDKKENIKREDERGEPEKKRRILVNWPMRHVLKGPDTVAR
jgi:hypothetical protein